MSPKDTCRDPGYQLALLLAEIASLKDAAQSRQYTHSPRILIDSAASQSMSSHPTHHTSTIPFNANVTIADASHTTASAFGSATHPTLPHPSPLTLWLFLHSKTPSLPYLKSYNTPMSSTPKAPSLSYTLSLHHLRKQSSRLVILATACTKSARPRHPAQPTPCDLFHTSCIHSTRYLTTLENSLSTVSEKHTERQQPHSQKSYLPSFLSPQPLTVHHAMPADKREHLTPCPMLPHNPTRRCLNRHSRAPPRIISPLSQVPPSDCQPRDRIRLCRSPARKATSPK
jgi:hypothetical protein